MHGIMRAAGKTSVDETQEMMMKEAQEVQGLLADLVDAVMEGFMKKHFPDELNGLRFRVTDAPNRAGPANPDSEVSGFSA